ncbi:hypothetical protein C8R45DRAFT_1020857 [Mycena sanguinolenta]|nr:hypothetical protein C8R45DRAFT_1020857 [Mycena sanguinolenta]
MQNPRPSAMPPPAISTALQALVPPPAAACDAIRTEQIETVVRALRSGEQTIRNLQHAISEACANGDTPLVERLMPQYTEKTTAYRKFIRTLQAFLAQQRQRAATFDHAQQAMVAQQGQTAEAAPLVRVVQQLTQQARLQKQGDECASPMITQGMQIIAQRERASQNRESVAVWQGLMTLPLTTLAGEPRAVSSNVIASSTSPKTCYPETWPRNLILKLSVTPAVPWPDMEVWMRRTEPTMCAFKANPAAEDPQHNEMVYKDFVVMLFTHSIYFVGSWTLPNGRHSNNLLIFPVQGYGLVGAFFPLTGIPDMPQPLTLSIIPNPRPPNPAATEGLQWAAAIEIYMRQYNVVIPPALMAQLVNVPPPGRNPIMAYIIRTGMEQRRRGLAAAAAAGFVGTNPVVLAGIGMPETDMLQQMSQPPPQQHQQQ